MEKDKKYQQLVAPLIEQADTTAMAPTIKVLPTALLGQQVNSNTIRQWSGSAM